MAFFVLLGNTIWRWSCCIENPCVVSIANDCQWRYGDDKEWAYGKGFSHRLCCLIQRDGGAGTVGGGGRKRVQRTVNSVLEKVSLAWILCNPMSYFIFLHRAISFLRLSFTCFIFFCLPTLFTLIVYYYYLYIFLLTYTPYTYHTTQLDGHHGCIFQQTAKKRKDNSKVSQTNKE